MENEDFDFLKRRLRLWKGSKTMLSKKQFY